MGKGCEQAVIRLGNLASNHTKKMLNLSLNKKEMETKTTMRYPFSLLD